METKLKNELLKMQTELSTLDNAVRHIAVAEKAATEAVKAAKELSAKFDSKIDSISKSYEEAGKKYESQIESIENFLASYALLSAKTETVINELKSNNLNSQVTEVTKAVLTLKTDIKNTQLLVENAYNKTKQQIAEIQKDASSQQSSNKPLMILIIVSIVMSAIAIAVNFVK